jgi:putative salt-induced outer membrane protein YdiY
MRSVLLFFLALLAADTVTAQAPAAPPPPPPLWDVQIGATFVGTSGNSETSSLGTDFGLNRRWPAWRIESTAAAVRTSDRDVTTAERYVGTFRGIRRLTSLVGVSGGTRLERDQFSGMDFRSITDAGLTWALVRQPAWTLEGVTSVAQNYERPTSGPDRNHPIGLLQLASRVPLGPAGATTQRFTFYPDFKESDAYRSEFEIAAQAAVNDRFALKLGYLLRRSNAPVFGFRKTDSMTTASVVVQWRAATAAPATTP